MSKTLDELITDLKRAHSDSVLSNMAWYTAVEEATQAIHAHVDAAVQAEYERTKAEERDYWRRTVEMQSHQIEDLTRRNASLVDHIASGVALQPAPVMIVASTDLRSRAQEHGR